LSGYRLPGTGQVSPCEPPGAHGRAPGGGGTDPGNTGF